MENNYTYVGNNPLIYIDPLGLETTYTGLASWYPATGNLTASGEKFDPYAFAAAMTKNKVPKLPTTVNVQYDDGQSCKSINVRVNDRGPFAVDKQGRALIPLIPHPTHIIDLTKAAFESLSGGSAKAIGVIPVTVTVP